jgi:di/tricarboxylate transporter
MTMSLDPALMLIVALALVVLLNAIRSDLNAGVLSLVAAYALGMFALGLTARDVAGLIPGDLVLTLLSVALLLDIAHDPVLLDRLFALAVRLTGGRAALFDLALFGSAFGISAIGAGNIAAVAILAPAALPVARQIGIRPLLAIILICTGANAGALSPVALTGVINIKLMTRIGLIDPLLPWRVFVSVAALQTLSAMLAWLLFGWRKSTRPALPAQSDTARQLPTATWVKLGAITLFALSVTLLQVPMALAAAALATLLGVLRLGDLSQAVQRAPWGLIVTIGGISLLAQLLERGGSLELAARAIAGLSSAGVINGVLALVAGALSSVSSSSGVVMPLLIPLIPKLAAAVPDADPVRMLIAIDAGAHMVDVSPLSTLGALCLATFEDPAERARLFRSLLIWGLSMAAVGAGLAWALLDVLRF